MTSDIPPSEPPSCCPPSAECFQAFGSIWASIRSSWLQPRESFGALPNMSAEPPPPPACTRAETCFYGDDCRRLSAAVRPRWPLQLWEALAIDRTFSGGQWHPSSGGDAGCDSIWGSRAVTVGGEVPLNVLLTSHWINTKKKSQFRNLPVRYFPQKRQNTKNVLLAVTHF